MSDRSTAVATLQDFLRRREAAGVQTIYLTEPARLALKRGIQLPSDGANAIHGPTVGTEEKAPEKVEKIDPAPAIGSPLLGTIEGLDPVVPVSCEGSSPSEKVADLHRQVSLDPGLRSLETLNQAPVFSSGDPSADLMLIAEAPGPEEEKAGRPVAGAAGGKLDQILKAMGLSRDSVYITNLCKFRPAMERGEAHLKRRPNPEEMRAWLPFLLTEIEIVEPRAIVLLGNTAAEGLLRVERASVARLRGRLHDLDGTPLMITHHPSHLILAEKDPDGGMAKKRLVWEDMLLVMQALDLPVSAKQQEYFR